MEVVLLPDSPSRKVLLERAILVDGEAALCMGRSQSADLVKNTLLKTYITTSKDWDIAAGICIPTGFTGGLSFPFVLRTVTVSLLPTLAFHNPDAQVPWSVFVPGAQGQRIIPASEELNHVEFLLQYASKHKARIDYSIFIYTKPLLLGQATIMAESAAGRQTFLFARILSCKELLDHGLFTMSSHSLS